VLPKLDTIVAIATAPGRGGIGIVRVSGDNLSQLAIEILGTPLIQRHVTFSKFFDKQGIPLDSGIALYFAAPHSYTGEDILELQGHGGTAVLQMVVQRCLELGARLAQPGEFTQRAFLNGKLDLAQAESVADLIDATTTQGVRSAVRSMQGEFSQAITDLVDGLIRLRMLVEAMLDFPEEEIESCDLDQRKLQLDKLCEQLSHIFNLAQQGSLLREGAHIVLAGRPNVGKSSLLNRLSGEDLALVSDIPGTTRDLIRQPIQIDGIPLHIIDTAGLRQSDDAIEQLGMKRTRMSITKADLIVVLLDSNSGITEEDQQIIEELPPDIPKIHLFNKIDINNIEPSICKLKGETNIYLSAKTGFGLDLLRDEILAKIGWHNDSGVFMARERHITALRSALSSLKEASSELPRAELFAENLRLAQQFLSSITGEFSSDDLLGEIFSRFCIGK